MANALEEILFEARNWAYVIKDSFEWPREAFYQQALDVVYSQVAGKTRLFDGGRVLEIGAGAGYLPHRLMPDPDNWIATDFSARSLETANERVGMPVATANMTGLPFADGKFGHIVGLAAFDVLQQPASLTAAREFRRVLADGGNVVLIQDLVPHFNISHFEHLDEAARAYVREYLTRKFNLERFWDEEGNCPNKIDFITALIEPGLREIYPDLVDRYGVFPQFLRQALDSEAEMIADVYDYEEETGDIVENSWKGFLLPQYLQELDLHRDTFNPDNIRVFVYHLAAKLLADDGDPVNKHALTAFIGQCAESLTGEVYEAMVDMHLRQAGFAEVHHYAEITDVLVPAVSMSQAKLGKGNSLALYMGSSMLEADDTVPAGMIRQRVCVRWTEARK